MCDSSYAILLTKSLLDPVLGVGPAKAAASGKAATSKGRETAAMSAVRFLDPECKEVCTKGTT